MSGHFTGIGVTSIPDKLAFFLQVPDYALELYTHEKFGVTLETSRAIWAAVEPPLRDLEPWTNDTLVQQLKGFAAEQGMKIGAVMWPIRIALTGLLDTPGNATEIASLLGRRTRCAESARREGDWGLHEMWVTYRRMAKCGERVWPLLSPSRSAKPASPD